MSCITSDIFTATKDRARYYEVPSKGVVKAELINKTGTIIGKA